LYVKICHLIAVEMQVSLKREAATAEKVSHRLSVDSSTDLTELRILMASVIVKGRIGDER